MQKEKKKEKRKKEKKLQKGIGKFELISNF